MAKPVVLVVEDHAATSRGLKMFLEVSGYTVIVTSGVASAVALGASTEFDVLLCDLSLPDGTGWDVLEQLKQSRPVAAVAFSAWGDPHHLARSKAAGFLDHIVKGSPPELLASAIARAAEVAGATPQQRPAGLTPT